MTIDRTSPPLRSVSVVTVLYNSADVIKSAMQSLPEDVEVILVDNASSDGGAAIARQARPDARLLRNRQNLGFGAGCQLGWQAARRPVILFLNPDGRIEQCSILRLYLTVMANPSNVVGPKVLTHDGTPRPIRKQLDMRWEALWLLPSAARWLQPIWTLKSDASTEHIPRSVAFVEGACFMIRRADLAAIGGFDPDLFLYCEEASIAARLARLGGGALYEPNAQMYHIGGTSTERVSTFARYHMYRSRAVLERKVRGELRGLTHDFLFLAVALLAFALAIIAALFRRRRFQWAEWLAILRGIVNGTFAPVDRSRYPHR